MLFKTQPITRPFASCQDATNILLHMAEPVPIKPKAKTDFEITLTNARDGDIKIQCQAIGISGQHILLQNVTIEDREPVYSWLLSALSNRGRGMTRHILVKIDDKPYRVKNIVMYTRSMAATMSVDRNRTVGQPLQIDIDDVAIPTLIDSDPDFEAQEPALFYLPPYQEGVEPRMPPREPRAVIVYPTRYLDEVNCEGARLIFRTEGSDVEIHVRLQNIYHECANIVSLTPIVYKLDGPNRLTRLPEGLKALRQHIARDVKVQGWLIVNDHQVRIEFVCINDHRTDGVMTTRYINEKQQAFWTFDPEESAPPVPTSPGLPPDFVPKIPNVNCSELPDASSELKSDLEQSICDCIDKLASLKELLKESKSDQDRSYMYDAIKSTCDDIDDMYELLQQR